MKLTHDYFPLDDFGCLCTFEHELHKRIAALGAELAWWTDHFLTADGDDAPTQIKKLEAEVERLRAVCDSQNLLLEVGKERDDG